MKTIYCYADKNEKEILDALEKANSLIYNRKSKVISLFYHEGLVIEVYNIDNMDVKQLAKNFNIDIVTMI